MVKVKKYKDKFKDLDNLKEIKKFNPKNDDEDNVSISESFEEENEGKENDESETIIEDIPEFFMEVERIMNINNIQIQNEFYKNNEKLIALLKTIKAPKLILIKFK